ncbi:zinc transporter 6 [Biomphalaria glabrata]|uniref:Zinc transporter 6-like n=1 Tax=Biomphalaria glabrata TaxID=6526 RepID=A0A9W3A0D4_BIOGL|nr:zinc transporter 6-like [Biomphalaria glabrata]XP_055880639.1 zinc transporter 6-like [Biomphalaria glabrata]XP_055880640.1 zinc transporter 6-like [Biomphalaria glabrata]XP_055880641.1 zinc transporter 6-like [Biomphalaria glabrata]XP_055880642.1 zinc transporter 6-like [Biomphalaria glabrata]KAI8747093.1 zinc transporter 6-like [Biomphalaria glabrata]KAI8788760.1 zinc transporter 6 [Biomphalaria glabrata]
MATYNRMPDLISSSVNIEEDDRIRGLNTHGTIYPFSSLHQPTTLGIFIRELAKLIYSQEAKQICCFLGFCLISSIILLYWCHSTNSMALTAFSFLLIFDVLSLLTCLLSVWVQSQQPSSAYSFGYERFEVLAVFSCTMLAQLGAFFILKESIECLLFPPDVHTGRLLVGTMYGLFVHLSVIYAVKNRAFNHVIDASSSSWLQEHVTDMSESLCTFLPGLSKLLLPRINPFSLIGFGCSIALLITYFLIDTHQFYIADPWAAIAIAIMTFGTMFPMSSYTGKILLQTTPSHILGQLDKVLREASTLEGVLEFRHEHFWTLSFGTLAGSVQVRVRRDADEQLVLAHVYNRLNNLVHQLTIQIFKDDWTRSSAYPSFTGQSAGHYSQPHVTSPTPYSSNLPHSLPPLPQSNRQPIYNLNPV